MPVIPRISSRAIRPVIAGLEALGYASGPLLSQAGISRAALDDPDGGVPHGVVMSLWEAATAVSRDGSLGLHVAEAAPVRSFDLHAYVFLSSTNLREAYRRACSYQRLIHEATQLTFMEGKGEGEGIVRHSLPGGGSVPRQPAEFLVAV